MVRHNYMKFIKEENGIKFYDLPAIDWNNFQFINRFKNLSLTERYTTRFYNLLLENGYDDMFLEDLVYLVNGIADPLDLTPGQKIKFPTQGDIVSFMEDEGRQFEIQ